MTAASVMTSPTIDLIVQLSVLAALAVVVYFVKYLHYRASRPDTKHDDAGPL